MNDCASDAPVKKPRIKWYVIASMVMVATLFMQSSSTIDESVPREMTANMILSAIMNVHGTWLLVVLLCLTFVGHDSSTRTSELKMDEFHDADVVKGMVLGVVCFFTFLGIVFLTQTSMEYFKVMIMDETIWHTVISNSTIGGKISIAVGVIIIIPIVEEIVFRHTMYHAVASILPYWFATVSSAALFAVAHGDLIALPAYFALALLLQEAYRRTDRLYVPITMHATFNVFILTFSQL